MDQYAVFSSFFFRAYALLWRLARPFLRRNKRLADGWKERLAPDGWASPADIWVQAASGGEALLALALLEALPAPSLSDPVATGQPLKVLISTWTAQGREVAERALPALRAQKPWLDVEVRFTPLDDPAIARRAVAQVRPRLLVLLETELWPGLLGACAEAGVPVHVVNARMTKASYECYRIIRAALAKLPLRRILAITREDADRFSRIFGRGDVVPHDIGVMPNIKFDRALAALDSPPEPGTLPFVRDRAPLFLLASVRQQEEPKLAPLLESLLESGSVIIAPRHMHRVDAWMERLHDLGLRPQRATALKEGQRLPAGRVVVWDTFGDLPRLYAEADAVFVGGSLGLGGQNFLEALAAGVIPCVGPSLENFRWALGEDTPPSLTEAGLLTVCPTTRALVDGLKLAAARPPDRDAREAVRARFRAWLAPRAGGAARAAACIMEELAKK